MTAPVTESGRDIRDTYVARDSMDRVIRAFPTEDQARRAAGRGGSVERVANAIEFVDFAQMIAESERRGTNDAGEALYFHPVYTYFKVRHDRPDREPLGYADFGGDQAPVEEKLNPSQDQAA